MAKTLSLLLLFLQLISFSAFAEEVMSLRRHTHASPLNPPTYPPDHHHHSHAPSHIHTPHPAKTPTHHNPPAHAPIHPPASAPHHHHHSPSPAPTHHHHHHHHSPSPAPTHHHHHDSPSHHHHHHHAAHAPNHTPRSFIVVRGFVYVKSCKHAGVDTLLGATKLLGAIVKLQCNNTKYKFIKKAKTDKNGYFFIEGSKNITSYGAHKCNVVLISAPNGLKPSNLNGGLIGAALRLKTPFISKGLLFIRYTVGPLAIEPRCPHYENKIY